METLTFSAIRPILPYVAPDWTIEVDGDEIIGPDLERELSDHEVTIIGDVTAGYDLIISVTTEWGDTYFYLANR